MSLKAAMTDFYSFDATKFDILKDDYLIGSLNWYGASRSNAYSAKKNTTKYHFEKFFNGMAEKEGISKLSASFKFLKENCKDGLIEEMFMALKMLETS